MKRKRSFDDDLFSKFLKENYAKLDESYLDENSIWAVCCTSVGFANNPKNRKLLYTRWKNNYAGIKDQVVKEKDEECIPEDSTREENVSAASNFKSDIEKMMEPSYAMLQCSNCSVFFLFASVTYDQCPLIDYLCSHCSISSFEYQKRTKQTTPTTLDNSATQKENKFRKTTGILDHGYCEENKKGMMVDVDNFVNEVTVETSSSPNKTCVSVLPNRKDSAGCKYLKNEHIIYISDTDKLKKSSSEILEESKSEILDIETCESSRYQFILSYNHWHHINNCRGNDFNIMCGKIFTQYFSQFELGCSLTFRQCLVNRNNDWKKDKFLKVICVCKHDFCAKYIFTIDTQPNSNENIVVTISQIGSICHITNIDTENTTNKTTNSGDAHKFLQLNQFENAEISVQEGSLFNPAQFCSSYYPEDPQLDDRIGSKSYENSSTSCDEEDLTESQANDLADIAAFDYSSHNQFTLDYKDWEKIVPSFDEQRLKKGWQQIFADYFSQFDLGCILEFAYCRLRKPFSIGNTVYLSTYAKCQYVNCSTFLFKITYKPIKGEIVIVDVFQQGCVSHKIDDAVEYSFPNKMAGNEEEDVYYTVNNLPEGNKDPLHLDVSQVVTVETSRADKHDIKSELVSSDTESGDDAYNIENQILPYELNNEGKILQSVIHKFEINYDDWQKMKPLKHCKTLQPGWTDIFFQYFANLNLGCILAFSYCYANKRSLNKKGTNYLRIKSICKYTGCCKYYFNMKKEPKDGKGGKVKAIQVGTISHKEGEVRARFIRGKYRKELAKELENTSAFDYYNQNRDRLAESGYDSTRKKSLHVLRNIKIKKKKDVSPDSSAGLQGSGNFDNFVNKIDDIRML